jgi:ketosteroid isomerase-like protein
MSKNNRILVSLLLLCFVIAACSASKKSMAVESKKHSPASAELYNTIAYMDSVLFNAFNSHDLEKLKTLFTEDLEFYHDIGGLTGYSENMEAFENNFAKNNHLKRELIGGSLEVYPVKEYGAMQIGEHRFCHTENGKLDCSTFKFVHIWKKTDGNWKISRVISYDH